MLAQTGATSQPPVPGAVGAGGATGTLQGAPSPAPGTGGGQQTPGFPNMFWILILGMLVVIIFSSMTGKKQEKTRKAMLSSVKRHDKVQTVGGLIGTVIELTDHEMVVESQGTRLRFARSALQQVIRESKDSPRADVEAKPRSETASLK